MYTISQIHTDNIMKRLTDEVPHPALFSPVSSIIQLSVLKEGDRLQRLSHATWGRLFTSLAQPVQGPERPMPDSGISKQANR